MQRGKRQRENDESGLPTCRAKNIRTSCPVCGIRSPVGRGGVTWKWLAVHVITEHHGYEFTEKGFRESHL
jgi:hypothetical protein